MRTPVLGTWAQELQELASQWTKCKDNIELQEDCFPDGGSEEFCCRRVSACWWCHNNHCSAKRYGYSELLAQVPSSGCNVTAVAS